MDIYETIIDALKKEYAAGSTYQELSQKYGISYQYLRELIIGKKPVERMSLEMFFKLFPRATVSISGGIVAPVVNNGHNSGFMVGVGNDQSETRKKILESSDLTAEEKIKMLKVLEK